MEYLVLLLAGVGVFVLAKIVLNAAASTARVMQTVEAFQATSLEAFRAIHSLPEDEAWQFRSVRDWERVRATFTLLSVDEESQVLSTLKRRGCQVSEIAATINAFKQRIADEGARLDAQLAELVQNS